MKIFLTTRQYPVSSSQQVAISIMAGIPRPRIDKHTEPTNEMNGARFGIIRAIITVKNEENNFIYQM